MAYRSAFWVLFAEHPVAPDEQSDDRSHAMSVSAFGRAPRARANRWALGVRR